MKKGNLFIITNFLLISWSFGNHSLGDQDLESIEWELFKTKEIKAANIISENITAEPLSKKSGVRLEFHSNATHEILLDPDLDYGLYLVSLPFRSTLGPGNQKQINFILNDTIFRYDYFGSDLAAAHLVVNTFSGLKFGEPWKGTNQYYDIEESTQAIEPYTFLYLYVDVTEGGEMKVIKSKLDHFDITEKSNTSNFPVTFEITGLKNSKIELLNIVVYKPVELKEK